MIYIQRRDSNCLETVSECSNRKEAKIELADYQLSDPSATYYLSSRCCIAWRD